MDMFPIQEEKESTIEDSRKSINDEVRTSMQSNHDVKNNNASYSHMDQSSRMDAS